MGDELFNEGRLDDVLEKQLERAASVVDGLPAKALSKPKKAVTDAIAELDVDVPTIARDQTKIDVIEGTPMTARVRIPYDGERSMFDLRPTKYSLAPPIASVRDPDDGGCLEFVHDFPVGTSPDEITGWATKIADSVEQYLYWQAEDVGLHRIKLHERVERLVDDRKGRLDAVGELQAELDDVREI
jgi:hypothetical protein